MGSERDVYDTPKDTEDPDGYLTAYGPVPVNLHDLCLGSGGDVEDSLPAMWECLGPFLHISCTEPLVITQSMAIGSTSLVTTTMSLGLGLCTSPFGLALVLVSQ